MDVHKVAANGIELAYEVFGDPADTPMLLIMGLGTQMVAWPDQMCADLAALGFYVVRYDNRDTGLSTHLSGVAAPSLVDVTLRRRRPPYTIDDMARDAVGLMDALGFESAHVVGASMGGFIAQTVAVGYPERVRSLTLIMTSTGSRRVGNPKPAVFSRLTKRRVVSDRTSAQQAAVETFRIIGSKGYAFDEEYLMHLGGVSYDRGLDGHGYMRQLAAIAGQPDRTARLRRLRIPTLVIHGLHDPLVAPSGGLSLARHLRNAKFVGYSGMGHDLPRELWPDMVDEIGRLARRTDEEAS
ncbi:MAG: alpha/beta hydrolase [Actinobacteria bacterium]|nr:alpha/beta hydrolase [Actinomycetota bacterium]MCB8997852.1 alpha/beta hydrolase [Actinomycetota bacterium]MCB9414254.1 alpha/beta hydrolase [Actinomycetota bacterium]MCB9423998.1 alpha/beta hydrolase [Actinomycetota bacterium]HRY09701.1 alpha/beta hydrolase [Candidatus Nanopelagicales bacterium]